MRSSTLRGSSSCSCAMRAVLYSLKVFPPSMKTTLLDRPPSCVGICARTHMREVKVIRDGDPCKTAKSPGLKPGKSWSTSGMFSVKRA